MMVLLIVASLFGYVLAKSGCEPAPLILGFVLGPLLEENLRRSMTMNHGDATVFLTRPISAALIGMAVVLIVASVFPKISAAREAAFVED